jgi:hypothetical protein
MKQRVKEMEAEAAKLREMQAQAERDLNMSEEGMLDHLSSFTGQTPPRILPNIRHRTQH